MVVSLNDAGHGAAKRYALRAAFTEPACSIHIGDLDDL